MRAKVAGVALVACGVLGVGAIAAPGAALASRGGMITTAGHDNGQQDNEYDHSCTSNDHAVIGNVCVIINDLPILGNILERVINRRFRHTEPVPAPTSRSGPGREASAEPLRTGGERDQLGVSPLGATGAGR